MRCNLYCLQRLSGEHFVMPDIPNPSVVRGSKISHRLFFFSNPCSKISAFFIVSSDYHSFLILTGKASELIPSSKLISEQKEVFRKLKTKMSVCSSAVTFPSTFASFYLNRLILYVISPSTYQYYYYLSSVM
jgi:hypothetical protein